MAHSFPLAERREGAIVGLLELGQKVDKFANEAKGARDVFARIVQRDGFGIRIKPRQKQSIGKHLRKRIGKFLQRQFMEDLVAEDLKKPVKPALPMRTLLPDEFLTEIVAQQPAPRGKGQRELLCATDAFGRGGEEAFQLATAATRSSRSRNF